MKSRQCTPTPPQTTPSYDPPVWDGSSIDAKAYEQLQKNPGKPLFSRVIQGGYAPGSTFKVITTAAAVSTASHSLSGTYACTTVYKVGNQTFTNLEGSSRRRTSRARPADTLIHEAKGWGFGRPTGIDLPIDGSGSILTRQDKIDAYARTSPLVL